jgi:hypothetical protein
MRSPDAIAAALGMLSYPRMAHKARRFPLPKGITFLLEIAAAEPDALRDAVSITGRSEPTLRKAAGFFIEQVMLDEKADYYRMLGASPSAPNEDIRRHMALIMRWLHPDLVMDHERDGGFNRSLYANRVIAAWDALKSQSRRSAYDSTRLRGEPDTAPPKPGDRQPSLQPQSSVPTGWQAMRPDSPARRRPAGLSQILNLFGFRL